MSGDDDVFLGRAELERAFAALGEHLASRDVIADVFVVGGAAMALAYDAKRVTRDVDARFVPHDIVLAEARRVAAEARIPAQGRDGCLCRMVGCCSWSQRSSTPE